MQWYIEYTLSNGHESATTIQATSKECGEFILSMEEGGAIVTKVVKETI